MSIVDVAGSSDADIMDIYSVKLHVQVQLPAYKSDVAVYKVQGLNGRLVSNQYRIEIEEGAGIKSNKCKHGSYYLVKNM